MTMTEDHLTFIASIRFSPAEWDRLNEVAYKERVSVSSLVRTGAAMVLDLLEEAHGKQGSDPATR